MSSAKQERELRRAVDRLSHCAIDDIEWVWSTLNDSQRSRLKPLLSSARADWKTLLETDASPVPEPHGGKQSSTDGPQLAYLIEQLPVAIGQRVLTSMDETQRQAVIATLPAARAIALREHGATVRITDRAHSALFAAAVSCASEMTAPNRTTPKATSRFMRWMGRR